MEPALLDAAGRRAQHDTIDEQLAAWCGSRSSDEIVDHLWDAGVPVGKVMQPHQQAELPPLSFRGFFEAVDHPVVGSARHSTMPIRFSRGPQRFLHSHAPLLGEHTRKVLAELGLTEKELDELEAEGVTGTALAR